MKNIYRKSLMLINQRARIVMLLSCFCTAVFVCPQASAQRVSAALDRDKILLGEQVILTLKAEDVNTRLTTLQWFDATDTSKHIEIVKKDIIDSADVGGLTTYTQKIILTSFDSGRWQLPPLKITVTNNADNKVTVINAERLALDVLPVDVSGLKEYHPIKDIIEVKAPLNIYLIIAIAAGTLILLFALWGFFIRKKKPKKVIEKPKDNLTNCQRALQRLDALQRAGLPSKEFFQKLDDIYRSYFDEELRTSTLQNTADELMLTMKIYLQDEKMRTSFFQLVRLAVAVKFAKYIPDHEQDKAINTVRAVLDYIDYNRKITDAQRMV